MKIVSRFRLQHVALFASMLALAGLIAAVPATVDLGDLAIKEKDAKATGGKDNDNDDGGDDGDDGGDDADDGGDDGDDGGDDGDDGGDDGDDGGDDGDEDGDDGLDGNNGVAEDAGNLEGKDGGDRGGEDGAGSGSTNYAVRIPLPTIGDPRGIPTMFVVYFDWDSDKLDERAQVVLSEAEAAIVKLGGAKVSVIGNTDRSGPTAYNEGLADRRAKAVAEALAQRGLPAKVVGRKGYGEARPLIKTGDGVRKRLNRRVEIVVEGPTQTANQ